MIAPLTIDAYRKIHRDRVDNISGIRDEVLQVVLEKTTQIQTHKRPIQLHYPYNLAFLVRAGSL